MPSAAPHMNDFTHTMMKTCEDMSQMLSDYADAASRSSAAALQGFEEMTRNVGSLMHESVARSVSASKTIMNAKTAQEAADTQAEFLKDCFDSAVAGGSKISEISLHAVKGAIDPLSQHANEAMGAIMKKAKAA
jgi:phasin family protein